MLLMNTLQGEIRKRTLDAIQDPAVEALQDALRQAYDEGYEHGHAAGVVEGREAGIEEIMEGEGPVGALIATVKEAQLREPHFMPHERSPWHYDSLIRFLEEGDLPPEWQP